MDYQANPSPHEAMIPDKLPVPDWMSQKLAKIVYKAKREDGGRTTPELINDLSFQAMEMLKLDLKAIPRELKDRLPQDFVNAVEKFSNTVLSPLYTASIIILEDESKALLSSAIETIAKLKAEGLSEYEATKAAGKDLAKLRIEALISMITGGGNG